MRKIKALAIGLVLGVAGFAYAAGNGAQSATQSCNMDKMAASCCGQGASCCTTGGSCCAAKMARR